MRLLAKCRLIKGNLLPNYNYIFGWEVSMYCNVIANKYTILNHNILLTTKQQKRNFRDLPAHS